MIDRRFGMDELGDGFGSELSDALEMGRLLQDSIDETATTLPGLEAFDAATGASAGFGDRVMATLADEPAPSATGFLLPLRRRGFLSGLWASFRQASVAVRGPGRPMLARAAALAYVLVLAIAGLSVTGVASLGAASGLGLLGPALTQSPVPATTPPSTITPPTALPPSVPVSPVPTPSLPPTSSPQPTDDHGGGGAEPSDDHGGSSAEPSDDHGGSSGSDG